MRGWVGQAETEKSWKSECNVFTLLGWVYKADQKFLFEVERMKNSGLDVY